MGSHLGISSLLNGKDQNDRGSTLPLMIGLFLILLMLYMMCVDVFVMRSSRMALEHKGELLLRGAFRKIAYDQYYFGEVSETARKSFIPFDCSELRSNIESTIYAASQSYTVVGLTCDLNQLTLVLREEVKLPFSPPIFQDVRPQVFSYTKGGVQRIGPS